MSQTPATTEDFTLADYQQLFGEQAMELALMKRREAGLLDQIDRLTACNGELSQELSRLKAAAEVSEQPVAAEAANGDFEDATNETN